MSISRRHFLTESALVAAAAVAATKSGLLPAAQAAQAVPADIATTKRGDMLFRKLGRTNEEVSLIGLGGYHIGVQKQEDASIRLIHAAIDRGINFMDNCWDYNDGQSEIRMGKALQGRRDKVFLMTKFDGRTKAAAARQINECLTRLQTDRIDLMQIHEIIRMEDPDRVFAPGGAMEALLEAKQAGKVRYIGFTGHKDPIVHARMLDAAAKHKVTFDAVQMPINVMDAKFRSFNEVITPRAVRDGIGVIAMKTFGGAPIINYLSRTGTASAIELLHFSMSQSVSTVVTGMESLERLDQAMEAVRTFKPMTVAQTNELIRRVGAETAEGRFERYKVTDQFDGTAKNPQWLS